MDSYYQSILDRFENHTIVAYPVLQGTYVWEEFDGACLLFELKHMQKHLRLGFVKSRMMTDEELSKYGKVISPRACAIGAITKVLQKMDESSFDGCCLIRYGDQIEFVPSYKCHLASLQFMHWLQELLKTSDLATVQDLIDSSKSQDCESHLFSCRHFLYFVQSELQKSFYNM